MLKERQDMKWKKLCSATLKMSAYTRGLRVFFLFIVSCSCRLIQWIRSLRALNETQKVLSLSALGTYQAGSQLSLSWI